MRRIRSSVELRGYLQVCNFTIFSPVRSIKHFFFVLERLAVFFSALWWLGLMCWSIFCPAHVTQENTNTPGYISVAHQNSNCCTLTSKGTILRSETWSFLFVSISSIINRTVKCSCKCSIQLGAVVQNVLGVGLLFGSHQFLAVRFLNFSSQFFCIYSRIT